MVFNSTDSAMPAGSSWPTCPVSRGCRPRSMWGSEEKWGVWGRIPVVSAGSRRDCRGVDWKRNRGNLENIRLSADGGDGLAKEGAL